MEDVYQATLSRHHRLNDLGFPIEVMWEHQWTHLKADLPDIGAAVKSYDLKAPLRPRDAFFGGRTNVVRLYVDPKEGQQLGYYDFTSLYPWVNKYGQYPIGHPTFIYHPENNRDLTPYFGIAKCTVLPPAGLFHPVLPYRCGGKLVFPLCRSCAEYNIDQPLLNKPWICDHNESKRQLTGTWCTPELEKALAKGYTLQCIHEVWHFERSQVGLFKDYVNTWLKIKEEASGFPSHCTTDAQRQCHVQDYLANEGVALNFNSIALNKGRRTVAKLMLNSMWGKFGQRLDKTHVEEFTDPLALESFLASGRYSVRYVSPITEERVEVHYKVHDKMIEVSPNLNIFVACFTTCHARLKLYEELERLDQRVVYFDTDSIIFLKGGDYEPSLGKYLGQFKDELKGDDIVEFCSGGPKNYGYRTNRYNPLLPANHENNRGTIETKVRGFTLNREGSRQLNLDVMINNVKNEVLNPLDDGQVRTTRVYENAKIVRNAKTYELFTLPRHKTYRLVANKRVFPPSDDPTEPDPFVTYPYGYHQVGDDPAYYVLRDLIEDS